MNDLYIETMARDYLITSLYGVPLLFMITFLITVFTSYGNTKITFKANSIGLLLIIVLDPIMIFGFFMIPKMGVSGAAWATTISRLVTQSKSQNMVYSGDSICHGKQFIL